MYKYVYTSDVNEQCVVRKGCDHGPAPIPEEGKWVKSKQITDISGLSHGIGWCAPQQGACKLTLNVKEGVIEESLVETIGCSGMTHSAAMAAEILQGKTLLEALNKSIEEIVGQKAKLSTAGGTSDGRFVAPLGTKVVEFGPLSTLIHKVNEAVDLESLDKLHDIYVKTLEKINL